LQSILVAINEKHYPLLYFSNYRGCGGHPRGGVKLVPIEFDLKLIWQNREKLPWRAT
jgi:hypothetical protein